MKGMNTVHIKQFPDYQII